jgi:hypothetical protein
MIWEDAVLVFLMGRIYEVRPWYDLKWHDTQMTFYDDRFRNSSNIKIITSAILEVAVLVLLMGGIYEVRHWDDLRLQAYQVSCR